MRLFVAIYAALPMRLHQAFDSVRRYVTFGVFSF